MAKFPWRIGREIEMHVDKEFAVKLLKTKPGKVQRLILPDGESFCVMWSDDFDHILLEAGMEMLPETDQAAKS